VFPSNPFESKVTAMDAERINQLIQITGAQWEAKDTPLSKAKVAPGAMKYMGLAISPSEISKEAKLAARTEPRAVSLQPPPPKVDWRNNGGNFVTEIKNQHECGACVAFATCAVLESRARIAQQAPHLSIDLSEAHLFACGCGDCCDTGWVNSKALDFARRKGIGAETDFPYNTMRRDGCKPINAIVKVKAYAAIETLTVRKKVVAAKGPVSASMEVYEDFLSYGRGIYQHVTGSLIGYHAVCVVGYDDTDQSWIVKNSWGREWGDGGFFKIAYGQCGIDTRFAFYDADLVGTGTATRARARKPTREKELENA